MTEAHQERTSTGFWQNTKLQFTVVFAVAFLLRVGCILYYGPILTNDSTYYLNLAKGILTGEGLGLPSRVMPLYPIFVAACRLVSESHWMILWAHAAMGALTCMLLFTTCRRLFQPKFAFCCGLAVSLYIPLAAFSALLLRETMIAFTVSVVTYCLTRLLQERTMRWAWATGIAYVATVFVQPTFVPFVGVLGMGLWVLSHSWRTAVRLTLPVIACLGIVLSLWATRNYLVTQRFIPFAGDHIGCYFLEGLMDANDLKGDKGLRPDQLAHLGISEEDPYITYSRLRNNYIKADLDTKLRDGSMLFSRALRLVVHEPVNYLRFSLKRLHWLWMKDQWVQLTEGDYMHLRPLDTLRAEHGLLGKLVSAILYLFGYGSLFAMILFWKRLAGLILPILTVLGLHMWIHAETRYALAIHPHILVFSLLTVTYLWQRVVRRQSMGQIESALMSQNTMQGALSVSGAFARDSSHV